MEKEIKIVIKNQLEILKKFDERISKQEEKITKIENDLSELKEIVKNLVIQKKKKIKRKEPITITEADMAGFAQLINLLKGFSQNETTVMQKVMEKLAEIEKYRAEGYMSALQEFSLMLNIISKLPQSERKTAIEKLGELYKLKAKGEHEKLLKMVGIEEIGEEKDDSGRNNKNAKSSS